MKPTLSFYLYPSSFRSGLFWRGATLFLSNGIGQALGFLGSVAVARLLGVESFGSYAAIMALVFVLGLLVEAGLEATLTREIAANPNASATLLRGSIIIKLWLGGVVSLILALPPVAAFLSPDSSLQAVVQLCGPLITLNALNASFGAVFRAWGRMNYVLLINVLGLGAQLAGTLVLLALFKDLILLFAWLIAIQVFEFLLGVFLFRREARNKVLIANIEKQQTERAVSGPFTKPSTEDEGRSSTQHSPSLLRRSWPFALAGVLGALTIRIDLFLIEGFRGAAQVGIYSAGTRLNELLALAPNSFFGALFPEMSSLHRGATTDDTWQLYRSALRRMVLVGVALALVALLLADVLIWVFFGPAFESAGWPLRVLAITLVPLLANRTTTVYLYATHREHHANKALALNLALRVVAGVLLVPMWGVTGAALAGLWAECLVVGFYALTGAMEARG